MSEASSGSTRDPGESWPDPRAGARKGPRGTDESQRVLVSDALRLAAEGDEAAWRIVVEHYTPRLCGLLRTQCADGDLAEEIAQSTFCTVAAKMASYVEAGKFEAWLFRIAVNRLRDEQRRRSRHARPTEDAALAAAAGAAPPERSGETGVPEDLRTALQAALDRLAPADQRVMHLRHTAGLSFKQIAEALDEPLGTVLARHHRALRKLRDLLGPAV